VLQERVHRRAYHIFQFSSFFYGAPCTSVVLSEGKNIALIYLLTFAVM
jgi:hypothetical protein